MELVYLWVEEYKNIKRQGFNFSSRFRCEYDGETQKLTIDEDTDLSKKPFSKLIKDISEELQLT